MFGHPDRNNFERPIIHKCPEFRATAQFWLGAFLVRCVAVRSVGVTLQPLVFMGPACTCSLEGGCLAGWVCDLELFTTEKPLSISHQKSEESLVKEESGRNVFMPCNGEDVEHTNHARL